MAEDYGREFYKKFLENPNLDKAKSVFGDILFEPIWNIIGYVEHKQGQPSVPYVHCDYVKASASNKKICVQDMFDVLKKAEISRKAEVFECHSGMYGVCLPVIYGDNLYGYIIACHMKGRPDEKRIKTLSLFIDSIISDTQKSLELSKLYETIRPRAIALSTIHTVHRLISSTLDIDELLPRIARLSLQVMRAKKCSIYLIDEKRKYLIPKASVDINNKKFILKNRRIGSGSEGVAAKSLVPVLMPKLLVIPLVDEDSIGVISLEDKLNGKPFNSFDQEILTTLAEQAVIAINNARLYEEQEKLTIGAIKSLAAMLDRQTPQSYRTMTAFVDLVMGIAAQMEIDKDAMRILRYAALLRNAGRVTIPDEVLLKTQKLTVREMRLIKSHPQKSVEMVAPLDVLKPAIPIIEAHHERYDGRGYPKGLKADQIPIGARIMSVAEAFEAMVCRRPYKKKLSIRDAIAEIRANAGTQFDPKVVDAFVTVCQKTDMRALLKKRGFSYECKKDI